MLANRVCSLFFSAVLYFLRRTIADKTIYAKLACYTIVILYTYVEMLVHWWVCQQKEKEMRKENEEKKNSFYSWCCCCRMQIIIWMEFKCFFCFYHSRQLPKCKYSMALRMIRRINSFVPSKRKHLLLLYKHLDQYITI